MKREGAVKDARFRISTHESGYYCVSIPNYQGGEVVAVEEYERLRTALQQIAAYGDDSGNMVLRKTGSYSGFDEPGAVQAAREALSHQKGASE